MQLTLNVKSPIRAAMWTLEDCPLAQVQGLARQQGYQLAVRRAT